MFGFAPHTTSTKNAPIRGKVPEIELEQAFAKWKIILIIILALVLIGVSIALIVKFSSG